MSSKNILIWTASYPPVLGGLQTVTQQLAEGLAERGHKVIVLTNRYPYDLPAKEQQGSVKVERIKHYRPVTTIQSLTDLGRSIRSQVGYPQSQRQITALFKSFQPDILNIHFPDPQLSYWPAIRKFFNGRLVISLHGHELLRWFREEEGGIITSKFRPIKTEEIVARNSLSKLLEEAQVITACSDWLLQKATLLCKKTNNNHYITFNSIDFQRFNLEKTLDYQPDLIFSAGRLDKHKGFDLLILAFAKIKPKFPSLKLEIAGEGKARKTLKKLIKIHQLEDNIKLIGRVNQEMLSEKLIQSRLVIIPSRRETFGISVLEAIASGRPVIATKVGGIPEAAGNFATLVPPTVEGIADGMLSVLQKKNQPVFNSSAIKEHLAQFSLERFIDQYEVAILGYD